MTDRTSVTTKPAANFKAMALRRMSAPDFLALGADKIVFVKPMTAEGGMTYGVYSASGEELMRMVAVTRPGVFRQNILESRDALVQVRAALATIEARGDG